MTAEEYLGRIKKIDHMIRNKLEEQLHWQEVAGGLVGGASVGERVQTTRNLHSGTDAIDRCIDIEAEIRSLQLEWLAIMKTIEKLPTDEYRVVCSLYVKGDSMKETAYTLGKSYEWVKLKKRDALSRVQDLIDEQNEKG